MVVKVRRINVMEVECVYSACLGTGLRYGVVRECSCSLGRGGETIVRRVSGRCDWVRIALPLAAAAPWNDGRGAASSRDDLGVELLEPLVLHDTADVLMQGFVEPGRIYQPLFSIVGEDDARGRSDNRGRIGRNERSSVALGDNTESCQGYGLVEQSGGLHVLVDPDEAVVDRGLNLIPATR